MRKILAIAFGAFATALPSIAMAEPPSEHRESAFNIQGDPIDSIEIYKIPRYLSTITPIMPKEIILHTHLHCIFSKDTEEFRIFLSEISHTTYYRNYSNGEFHWQIEFRNHSGDVIHRLYSGPFYDNVTFVNAIWDGKNITIENRFLRWAEDYVNAESGSCEDQNP